MYPYKREIETEKPLSLNAMWTKCRCQETTPRCYRSILPAYVVITTWLYETLKTINQSSYKPTTSYSNIVHLQPASDQPCHHLFITRVQYRYTRGSQKIDDDAESDVLLPRHHACLHLRSRKSPEASPGKSLKIALSSPPQRNSNVFAPLAPVFGHFAAVPQLSSTASCRAISPTAGPPLCRVSCAFQN